MTQQQLFEHLLNELYSRRIDVTRQTEVCRATIADKFTRDLPGIDFHTLTQQFDRLDDIIALIGEYLSGGNSDVDASLAEVSMPVIMRRAVEFYRQTRRTVNLRQTYVDSDVREIVEHLPVRSPFARFVAYILVDNASKYVPINQYNQLDVNYSRIDEGTLSMTVTNMGPELDVDEPESLFSEGFRGQAAEDHTSDGQGCGLSYLRRIVERLGWSIEYNPEPAEQAEPVVFNGISYKPFSLRITIRLNAADGGDAADDKADDFELWRFAMNLLMHEINSLVGCIHNHHSTNWNPGVWSHICGLQGVKQCFEADPELRETIHDAIRPQVMRLNSLCQAYTGTLEKLKFVVAPDYVSFSNVRARNIVERYVDAIVHNFAPDASMAEISEIVGEVMPVRHRRFGMSLGRRAQERETVEIFCPMIVERVPGLIMRYLSKIGCDTCDFSIEFSEVRICGIRHVQAEITITKDLQLPDALVDAINYKDPDESSADYVSRLVAAIDRTWQTDLCMAAFIMDHAWEGSGQLTVESGRILLIYQA